jgi:hypothetical protein
LDVALQLISKSPRRQTFLPGHCDVGPFSFRKSIVLKHRGYVKHLMGDYEGAKEDDDAAQQLQLDTPVTLSPLYNPLYFDPPFFNLSIPTEMQTVQKQLRANIEDCFGPKIVS